MKPSDKLAAHVAQTLGGRLHGREVLFRVYNTALDMMQDRGFVVADSCQSEEQILQRIDEGKPLLRTDGKRPTLVCLDAEERTGVKTVRTLREQHPHAALCIINADGPTPFTKKEVADCEHIEFWQVHELLMNPTRHHLVPSHAALTSEETAQLQVDRCIQPHQWPAILATDIIVRWYHFPKGAVLRIGRKGVAHEQCDYFRRVE